MTIVRSVLSVLAGIIAGAGLNVAVVGVSGALYPPPAGLDYEQTEAVAAYVASLPPPAFLIVLAGHFIGTLFGAWLAARLAGRSRTMHSAIVAGVFLVFGIVNLVQIPHPIWVQVLDVLAYPAAGWLAGRLANLAAASDEPRH